MTNRCGQHGQDDDSCQKTVKYGHVVDILFSTESDHLHLLLHLHLGHLADAFVQSDLQ